jgi:hypothetical protein
VWGRVDEVGEGDEGGGEADCGAVEGCDEDFGVGVELVMFGLVVVWEVWVRGWSGKGTYGVCDVQIIRDEALEPLLALVN